MLSTRNVLASGAAGVESESESKNNSNNMHTHTHTNSHRNRHSPETYRWTIVSTMKNIKRVKWFTSKTQANERMSNDKKDEQQKQKNGIRNERLIGFVLRRQRRYLCSHLLKSMYTCTVYAFMRTVKIGRHGCRERETERETKKNIEERERAEVVGVLTLFGAKLSFCRFALLCSLCYAIQCATKFTMCSSTFS